MITMTHPIDLTVLGMPPDFNQGRSVHTLLNRSTASGGLWCQGIWTFYAHVPFGAGGIN